MMHSWSPDTLIGFSGSFWGASALHAAIRLDFFTPLQHGPLSIQDLARETGCSLRGLEMLAASMCALNFCIRQEDRISLTPFAAQYLCKNSPDYLGFIINHHADLVHSFADLSDAIKTNQPSRSHDGFRTDIRERESFIMGMYNMAYIRAEAAVQLVSLQGSKWLIIRIAAINYGLRDFIKS